MVNFCWKRSLVQIIVRYLCSQLLTHPTVPETLIEPFLRLLVLHIPGKPFSEPMQLRDEANSKAAESLTSTLRHFETQSKAFFEQISE